MDQRFPTSKVPFLGSLARNVNWGSIGTGSCALLPGFDRRSDLLPPESRSTRLAKKAGYEVVGIWEITGPVSKDERAERKRVLALAQARKINSILVMELTRWGRLMLDLFHTLQDLQAWSVLLVAQTSLQFDLRSAQCKLIASLMVALGEFGRDLFGLGGAHGSWRQFHSRVWLSRDGIVRPSRGHSRYGRDGRRYAGLPRAG